MNESRLIAERVARESYGRLVAFLSRRCRDLNAIEDAISQAFLAALEQWPDRGVPDSPEAWLLTVSRRKLIDQRTVSSPLPIDQPDFDREIDSTFPDERLKLMFACTHPAIDPAAQVPLILQTVLGFDAEAIAKAFVVPAATMGQRLVRAKQRIRDLAIPFEVPSAEQWADRLDALLQVVYVLYDAAWSDGQSCHEPHGLSFEAIHLAKILIELAPSEPEPLGLLALILHGEARRPARFDDSGRYVPLLDQDTSRWNRAMMQEAEDYLWKAARLRKPGRFQLEAAIQSAHNRRAFDGITPWEAIDGLYRHLVEQYDSYGARVAWAAIHARWREPEIGLALLDQLPTDAMVSYQPYWAVRAKLLEKLNRLTESIDCYDRAMELNNDLGTKAYLQHARLAVVTAAGVRRSSPGPADRPASM